MGWRGSKTAAPSSLSFWAALKSLETPCRLQCAAGWRPHGEWEGQAKTNDGTWGKRGASWSLESRLASSRLTFGDEVKSVSCIWCASRPLLLPFFLFKKLQASNLLALALFPLLFPLTRSSHGLLYDPVLALSAFLAFHFTRILSSLLVVALVARRRRRQDSSSLFLCDTPLLFSLSLSFTP